VDQREIRMLELVKLEELRKSTIIKLEQYQQSTKRWFDRKDMPQDFKLGDLVLKWDADRAKTGHHSKFDAIWSVPYIIISCKDANSFDLSHLDGGVISIPINGIYLKTFH